MPENAHHMAFFQSPHTTYIQNAHDIALCKLAWSVRGCVRDIV
jgi:hypothetical protein